MVIGKMQTQTTIGLHEVCSPFASPKQCPHGLWGLLIAILPLEECFTLSVGYSSMGNKELLQRETITFGIGVSTCERWFVKRKYN